MGAVHQVGRVVIQDELCQAHVYRAGVGACCELSGELFGSSPAPDKPGRCVQRRARVSAEIVARLHVLDPAGMGRLPAEHLAGLVV